MPRPNTAFRPRLEALEAREVPAFLVWTNAAGTGDFDTAANWADKYTLLAATQPPTGGDDLYFDGSVSSANCINFRGMETIEPPPPPIEVFQSQSLTSSSSTFEYHSVNLINSYTGTVTLSSGFDTAILVLTSGAIAQPTAGTDITVSGSDTTVPVSFNWTGGTLNSSANEASVNLNGDGSIAPLNDGTVITGSTLSFIGTEAPTTTTIQPGTVQFNNAASAVIGFAATVRVDVITGRPGTINGFMQAGANRITILDGGSLEYRGIGTASTNMPISNSSGLFKLNGQVTVTLSGGSIVQEGYIQQNSPNAKLHLVNGSTLVATNGVRVEGGSINPFMNPDLPAAQQVATIQGKLNFIGGDIVFSPPIAIGGRLVYGGFTVLGDVFWSGGRYIPSIDCAGPGFVANLWKITGTLTVDTSNPSKPRIEPNPLRLPVGQQPSGTWLVIDANNIQGNDPILPEGWRLLSESDGGVKKRWYVKK